MKIILNGNETDFSGNLTVAGLLKELDIEPATVAVEVNLEIVKKQEYHGRVLKDGDLMEVVNFVGGG